MDLQEYWEYMHQFNKQFSQIFGVKDESTQQTESSANEATEHKAE